MSLGHCDFKQYEHCGPHEQIGEHGQRLPPFACKNWRRDEAAEREQQQVQEAKRERLRGVATGLLHDSVRVTADAIRFTANGYRYEIREVAAHREE